MPASTQARRRILVAALIALILGAFAAPSLLGTDGPQPPRHEDPTAASMVEYAL